MRSKAVITGCAASATTRGARAIPSSSPTRSKSARAARTVPGHPGGETAIEQDGRVSRVELGGAVRVLSRRRAVAAAPEQGGERRVRSRRPVVLLHGGLRGRQGPAVVAAARARRGHQQQPVGVGRRLREQGLGTVGRVGRVEVEPPALAQPRLVALVKGQAQPLCGHRQPNRPAPGDGARRFDAASERHVARSVVAGGLVDGRDEPAGMTPRSRRSPARPVRRGYRDFVTRRTTFGSDTRRARFDTCSDETDGCGGGFGVLQDVVAGDSGPGVRARPGSDAELAEPQRVGRETVRRTWLFNLLLATVAVALYVTTVTTLKVATPVVQLPWAVLASLFCAAEAWRVYVHVRRNAISFSLSELPLVLGLYFASPATLVSARMAGGVVALMMIRRYSPIKVAFNLAVQAVEAEVALWLLSIFEPARNIGDLRSWVIVVAITAIVAVLGFSLTAVVIWLAEGSLSRAQLARGYLFSVGAGLVNACLAIEARPRCHATSPSSGCSACRCWASAARTSCTRPSTRSGSASSTSTSAATCCSAAGPPRSRSRSCSPRSRRSSVRRWRRW